MPSNSAPDRRHEHQPLDLDAIGLFLAGRAVASAELLGEGKSNSNYLVSLDNGLRCVIRIHSGDNAPLEAFIAGLMQGRVPVPELLFEGDGCTIWEFVEGHPLRDEPDEVREAAAVLPRIWETTFDAAGELLADGSVQPWPFGDRFVEMMLENRDVQAHLGPDLLASVTTLVEEDRRESTAPEPAHLVHGDFNPTNVLIDGGRVSAVLDWEFAHSGGPWGDIGNLRRHVSPANRQAIAEGLTEGGFGVPADWQQRAAMADLGSHLEFLTSARSDAFKATRVELIRELVEGRR